MAIVHVGNFHGVDWNNAVNNPAATAGAANFTQFASFSDQAIRYDSIVMAPTVAQGLFSVGRDIDDNTKSCIKFKRLVAHATGIQVFNININFNKLFVKLEQGTDDCIVIGFRLKWTSGNPTTTPSVVLNTIINSIQLANAAVSNIIPASVLLYHGVTYNLEFKFSRTGTIHTTNMSAHAYVNKVLIGSTLVAIAPTATMYNSMVSAAAVPNGNPGLSYVWNRIGIIENSTNINAELKISDIYAILDKATDTDKTGFIGPLEVRHYSPTEATDVETWNVIDGSASSIAKPNVSIIQALNDTDIGKVNADKTLALTDKSGKVGKFKFNNIPAGNYLGYSLDVWVNKPQGQAGDLLTEVFEGASTTPLNSIVTQNIVQTPGEFDIVKAIAVAAPVTDVQLKNLTLAVGSKKVML